nr:tonB-system energizer ExbB [uncultured Hyphomicrobium sp.]
MYSLNVPGWRRRGGAGLRLLAATGVIVSMVAAPLAAQEQVAPAATPAPPAAPAADASSPPPAAPSEPTASDTQSTLPAAPSGSSQTTPPAANATQPAAAAPDSSAMPSAPSTPSVAPDSSDANAPPAASAVDTSHLPRDLSPWSMFMSADIVVKAVMIGLAFASVVTWTVWLAKTLELTWAKRRLSQAFSDINASSTLAEAGQRLGGKKGIVSGLIELAAVELHLSADVSDKSGIKERVASRLDGLAAAAGRDMNRGTGVLATIGSTSPFVGLFGTVWGIMNSFIGISEAQTTNLAIVAPGIAEALLATAIGLVAAIPAVIIYNQFARQIGGYRAMIAEASAEVMRLVSRDLDRGFKVVKARAAE